MEPESSWPHSHAPSPAPILSQINPVHAHPSPPIPLKINFNIILPSTPRSSKWSHIPFAISQVSFSLLVLHQSISPSLSPCQMIHNVVSFYGVEFISAPSPTPKLGECLLSAARDCLFNVYPPYLQAFPPSATWRRPNIKTLSYESFPVMGVSFSLYTFSSKGSLRLPIIIWNLTTRVIMSQAHQILNFCVWSLMTPYHGRLV